MYYRKIKEVLLFSAFPLVPPTVNCHKQHLQTQKKVSNDYEQQLNSYQELKDEIMKLELALSC
jgi:hypothetical protein